MHERAELNIAYQTGLNELGVGVLILRRRLHLQDNLDEAAWEVLNENEVLEC